MLPDSVSHYLSNYAPEGGDFVGYWLDAERMYNVLTLFRREGAHFFAAGTFPEQVGHWGHQLEYVEYPVEQAASLPNFGLSTAGDSILQRVRLLVARIQAGGPLDDVLAECRAAAQLPPITPPLPVEPPFDPPFTSTHQFQLLSSLAATLAGGDAPARERAAARLKAMGITENKGPLFAREALMRFHRR